MRWQSLLLENCGPPLPGAEEGGTQFPQPRHWPAASEGAAGEWHLRQGVPGSCRGEAVTDEVLYDWLRAPLPAEAQAEGSGTSSGADAPPSP